MTQKEIIKKLGFKDYITYNSLRILEIIINLPYNLLRTFLELTYSIFAFIWDKFEDLLIYAFSEEKIIKLAKISKKANDIRKRVRSKLKE